MKLKLYLSLSLLIIGTSLSAQIVINEIMYNPPESGTDSTEFIEIYNAGANPVNIDGYHFLEGVEDTVVGVVLEPGAYYVFCESASAMFNVFNVVADQWTDGALGNGGETIILADANGNMVDMVEYDDGGDWPDEPDGDGPSLELISPDLDNSNPANWQASFTSTGIIVESNEIKATPGAANSMDTGGPDLMIETKNLKFDPDFAVIEKGDLVRWFNNEGVPHNVNGQTSNYPNNPASIFSGTAQSGPWEFDFTFDADGFYDYHCDPHLGVDMIGALAVYDPEGYTPFTYAQVRDNLTDDVITLFDGVPTVLTGIVHGINFSGTGGGYSFYMMNADNRGVNVFSFNPVSEYVVNEGDEIRIWGEIDQFRGLLEIVPDSIQVLSSGNSLVTPRVVDEVTESEEGSLIQITGLTLDSVQTTGTSGANLFLSKDGNVTVMRYDSDTDIDIDNLPSGALSITGIGNQFDTSSPYDGGYQILPRYSSDIEGVSSVTILSEDAIELFPNPTNSDFSLSTDQLIERVELYTLDGKLQLSKVIFAQNATINVADLNIGMYVVKARTENGVWSSKLMIAK